MQRRSATTQRRNDAATQRRNNDDATRCQRNGCLPALPQSLTHSQPLTATHSLTVTHNQSSVRRSVGPSVGGRFGQWCTMVCTMQCQTNEPRNVTDARTYARWSIMGCSQVPRGTCGPIRGNCGPTIGNCCPSKYHYHTMCFTRWVVGKCHVS